MSSIQCKSDKCAVEASDNLTCLFTWFLRNGHSLAGRDFFIKISTASCCWSSITSLYFCKYYTCHGLWKLQQSLLFAEKREWLLVETILNQTHSFFSTASPSDRCPDPDAGAVRMPPTKSFMHLCLGDWHDGWPVVHGPTTGRFFGRK